MCGEHPTPPDTISQGDGSSPRVRGTHQLQVGVGDHPRFIPACAGNTPVGAPRRRFLPVHPRVCGEHSQLADGAYAFTGSSPRVRGTHRPHRRRGWDGRFIPACAGNTRRLRPAPRPVAVHPRVCGEHTVEPGQADDRAGFIPACAGNTSDRADRCATPPVHPRVCGEHDDQIDRIMPTPGSSPRVRGTRRVQSRRDHQRRFIPACAGNTGRTALWRHLLAVHPRVCGEHGRRR